jgi:hypothetical protein
LRPKSKTVGTSGAPKWRIQMWFTATRAASGLSGLVIQFASAVRRPVLVGGKTLPSGAYASVGWSTATRAACTAATWPPAPRPRRRTR